MKKKVVILLIIISIFTILSPAVYASTDEVVIINNHGISITKSQYNNLLNLGYNEYLIKNMNQDEFDANKNLSATMVSKQAKYIKVIEYFEVEKFDSCYKNGSVGNLTPIKVEEIELTKEQYENETRAEILPKTMKVKINTTNGEIGTAKVNTAYKMLQTSISKLDTGQYRARSDLVWTKMPANRAEDLLRTEVGSNVVPIDSSRYGKQLWTLTDSNNKKTEGEQVYSSTSSKWQWDNEYSRILKPNLKNDEGSNKVTFLWIYMYYNLSKNYDGTILGLDAYGEYKHWRPDGYDSMPQTHAQANNVNW